VDRDTNTDELQVPCIISRLITLSAGHLAFMKLKNGLWKKLTLAGVVLAAGAVAVSFVPTSYARSTQKMFIPAYFYPGSFWTQAKADAPTVGFMVMNPASGPGTSQNSDYVTAVNSARAAGIKVIGYVHTSYGARDAATVKSEVDAFKLWYHVDGIFLDETASDAALIPYYQDVANYIRATSGTYVALNPGVIPAEGYMNVGDTVAVFEGTYNTYKNWVKPSWASKYPTSKFTHLIHATSGSSAMKNAIKWSKQRRAGNVYVTNDVLPNPWDILPSYWSSELNEIKR
jgi:hypothetical protein